MTAKLIPISAYTRRTPVDRYAAVRAAKTADLYEYVHGDHMTKLLHDALDLMDVSDIQRDRLRETH